MCGKKEDSLVRTLIEGVDLTVCNDCSRFGKVISAVKRETPQESKKIFLRKLEQKEEKLELIAEDYAQIIKQKRESLKISQQDFAKRLNEKESTIHHIETGTLEPNIALAKKLEKALGIKLIEEYEEKHEKSTNKNQEGFTLGDFIKVKK